MSANVGTLLVEIGADVARLRRDMGKAHQEVANAAARMSRAMNAVGLSVAGAFSISTITQAAQAIFKAQVEAERLAKAYGTIEGSAAGARQQLAFLRSESERLGMQYQQTAMAAKAFFASGKGTALEGEMNRIFSSVSEAGTALSLSQDELNGIFMALGQMISKGKVQAEELRGQLGERLPGAFGLAAKAMGITTGELDKMLEEGKVLAEDLLPKLADAMHAKFGKAAMEAAKGGAQEVNRMSSEWESFKANVLDSGPMVAAIKAVTDALKSGNEELIARQMRDKGIKPEGSSVGSDWVWFALTGTPKFDRTYSDKQIRAFKEYGTTVSEEINRQAQAQQKASREDYASQALERLVGKASASSKDFLKGTDASKAQKIRQEAQEAIDAQKKARDADAANADVYSKRIVQIERERDKQLSEIGKSDREKAKRAQEDRMEAIRDIEKASAEVEAQTKAINDEIEAIRAVSGLFGSEYTEQLALIQARTKAQEEARKETEKGVFAETANAKDKAQVALEEQKIAERRAQAAKSLASGFSGQSYEAERSQLMDAYAEAAKYSDDRKALEAELQRKLAAMESARLKKTESHYDGAKAALLDYTDSVGTAASRMGDLWSKGFKGAEDSMSNFIGKGKLDLASLFEMLRVEAARATIVQPLLGGFASALKGSSWLSALFSANGNAFGPAGLMAFADGGVVSSPTAFRFGAGGSNLGIMGEAGPEAILPLRRGSDGKLGVAAGGSSAPTNITFNVIDRTGKQVKLSASNVQQTDDGLTATLLLDMVNRNVGGLRTGLQSALGK